MNEDDITPERVVFGDWVPSQRHMTEAEEAAFCRAVDVVKFHTPDPFGFCAGCVVQWARIVPHEACSSFRWAVGLVREVDHISGDRPRWVERGREL